MPVQVTSQESNTNPNLNSKPIGISQIQKTSSILMTPGLFGTPKIESWNRSCHLSALKIADLKKPSTLQPLSHNFCSSLWRSEQRCPDPFYPECQKAASGRQSWQLEYRFPSRNMKNYFLTMPRINFGFDLNTNKRVYVKSCPLDVFCFRVPRQPSNRSKHLLSRVEIPETSLEIRWN